MRGASYALRAGAASARETRTIDVVFALSSVLTPFALGTMIGAIAAQRVPVGNAGRPPVLQLDRADLADGRCVGGRQLGVSRGRLPGRRCRALGARRRAGERLARSRRIRRRAGAGRAFSHSRARRRARRGGRGARRAAGAALRRPPPVRAVAARHSARSSDPLRDRRRRHARARAARQLRGRPLHGRAGRGGGDRGLGDRPAPDPVEGPDHPAGSRRRTTRSSW